MRQTRLIMGMPITVEIVGDAQERMFQDVFAYFSHVDEKFSTYKATSEITAINEGRIADEERSEEMKTVFELCEETKKATGGYFDIRTPQGTYDPSGLVKGWAIYNTSEMLLDRGVENFFIEAGGDIQPHGHNNDGKKWAVGIKNPFKQEQVIKVLSLSDEGIATSGTYIRGAHIYNPLGNLSQEIVSFTVVGPNVYEADRFATAAFAMGKEGIHFIENLPGFEAYSINAAGIATMTTGFERYVAQNA